MKTTSFEPAQPQNPFVGTWHIFLISDKELDVALKLGKLATSLDSPDLH